MPATVNFTEAAVLTALGDFLTTILPAGAEVVQGQANRVPSPKASNYVVMTSLRRDRLATNIETWDPSDPAPAAIAAQASTRVTVQLDLHGPQAADNAQILTTLFRSSYACAQLARAAIAIQPLEISDPRQAPFITGENQYEDRWAVDVSLQINPTVTTPQDFADALEIGLIDVDAEYPPGG